MTRQSPVQFVARLTIYAGRRGNDLAVPAPLLGFLEFTRRGIGRNEETSMQDVTQRVQQVVGSILKINETQIVATARFVDDLHATSLDVVELIMALEDAFAIEISDTDAERILTVGDAAEVVGRKVRRPAVAA
jgi:acyl carrier protein